MMHLSLPMGCGHCAAFITDYFTLCQLGAIYHQKTSIICDKLLSVLCFFIYLLIIMHHCWFGFGLALVFARKEAYMMVSVMDFLRRHIMMSEVVKSCAGLVIGFG